MCMARWSAGVPKQKLHNEPGYFYVDGAAGTHLNGVAYPAFGIRTREGTSKP